MPGPSSGTAYTRADAAGQRRLFDEEVHLIWSDPASATIEQVNHLAVEVLTLREALGIRHPALGDEE
jgi:hypothetical protein